MIDTPRPPSTGGTGTGKYDLSDLEPSYRDGLEEMATREGRPVDRLLADIDASRGATDLAAAVRAVVLTYFRIVYENRSGMAAPAAPSGDMLERAMAVLKDGG